MREWRWTATARSSGRACTWASPKLGGDYFGVDVNVAARVATAAGPGEVLVSDAVHQRLGRDELRTRRRWRFKAKGAPENLKVYTVKAAG